MSDERFQRSPSGVRTRLTTTPTGAVFEIPARAWAVPLRGWRRIGYVVLIALLLVGGAVTLVQLLRRGPAWGHLWPLVPGLLLVSLRFPEIVYGETRLTLDAGTLRLERWLRWGPRAFLRRSRRLELPELERVEFGDRIVLKGRRSRLVLAGHLKHGERVWLSTALEHHLRRLGAPLGRV